MLVRLSEAAEGAGWVGRTVEVLVLRSVALLACGDKDAALSTLARGLVVGFYGTSGMAKVALFSVTKWICFR